MNVATSIGDNLFSLLNACFPDNSKRHKTINKNNLTQSYNCMTNMKQKMDKPQKKNHVQWIRQEGSRNALKDVIAA